MKWTRGPIIGQGSSATVSAATTTTGHLVAVKSTTLATSASLQKEQQILSQLTSKHVIQYMGYDITYNNNKPMYNMFMEHATYGSVHDMIKKHGGSLDECLIRSYTYQTLLGLHDLHVNNIVHCDIKCRNLLVCEDGVKIGDFGCAKTMENNDMMSKSTRFSGTPVFMAPEVARGEEQGFLADVWALGCVVIEMATGLSPWVGLDDLVSGLYRIGYSGEVPEFPKCFSDEGKDFLDKCLKVDVEERWTVKELLQHPFVCNSNLNNSSYETKNSPTSVLDQGFWECLPVLEVSMEVTRMVKCSNESPMERIRRLVEATPSCLPRWGNEGDWIAVRNNRVEEMNVECSDYYKSMDVESFSSFNMIVDEEENELENLVTNEYNTIF